MTYQHFIKHFDKVPHHLSDDEIENLDLLWNGFSPSNDKVILPLAHKPQSTVASNAKEASTSQNIVASAPFFKKPTSQIDTN